MPIAPLWRRFAALVYDSLVLVALSMTYGAGVVAIYAAVTGQRSENHSPMVGGLAFQIGWLAVIAAFYCYFWHRGGQTLGMRAWRIRLESVDGGTPAWRQCLLRCAMGPFALLLGGIGYWSAWLDSHRHCLHDRLSGTRVVVLPKRKKQAPGPSQ